MSKRGLSVFLVALTVSCGDGSRESVEIQSVQADAAATELRLTVNSCHQDPEVRVEESENEVRLTVLVTSGNGDDCADGVGVKLESPLGTRVVLDTFTGKEVSMAHSYE